MIFCSMTKYNDNPPPIRLYTNPWLFFLPNSTFYRLMRGFHITFVTGVACWQGTLTPPDTWSRPIWDLHMFYLLRPIIFPNLSWFFPDYSLWTSLSTFSILLDLKIWNVYFLLVEIIFSNTYSYFVFQLLGECHCWWTRGPRGNM